MAFKSYKTNYFNYKHLIFGSPLHNSDKHHHKVGILGGLTLLGADALSSVAYATEEIILALTVLGPAWFYCSIPISLSIIFTMMVVILSYRQTVQAYPTGGGAYGITRHELGKNPALLAAAALFLDYILTVTVSIAAGVRALVSCMPPLYPYTLHLSLMALLLLGWLSLRGVRESARLLCWPLLLFLGGMVCLMVMGLKHAPSLQTPPMDTSLNMAAFFIIMRAFAGGCTAMTGIEAVANAVTLFKEPAVKHAQKLYTHLALWLMVLFGGISYLIYVYQLTPHETESLISSLARHIWGDGWLHTGFQVVTAFILFLAANTAFSGYPRLCAVLATDKWMPKQLAQVGDRLVYHKGILLLMVLSAVILIIFKANVHHLIPLYALGVMTAFTLSQLSVSYYWKRMKKPLKRIISLGGSICTAVVFLIFLESKFKEGAFLFPLLMLMIIPLFKAIHHHYTSVEKQLHGHVPKTRVFSELKTRKILVPVFRMHLGSLEALAFAREMSQDVEAILVSIDHYQTKKIKQAILDLKWDIHVTVLPSPYRSLLIPLIHYIRGFDDRTVLILPEIVPQKRWQRYLHNQTVMHLIQALEYDMPFGSTRIIIMVPYHLK